MEKREAKRTVLMFLDSLAYKYSYEEWHKLSEALDLMVDRYGVQFVSDAIKKDRKDAELALFRYYKKHQQEMPEPEEEPREVVRWHKAYPKQRGIAKRFIAMIVIMLGALVILTMGASVIAMRHSDDVIARADRVLEVYGK